MSSSCEIAGGGPRSALSSTYGLDNSSTHLHYRNCKRAGANPLIAIHSKHQRATQLTRMVNMNELRTLELHVGCHFTKAC